jgi:hypothetical protein
MPARLNFSQTSFGQPLTLSLSSLLTLPGVIPPILVPEAVQVPQFQLRGLGRFTQQTYLIVSQLLYMPVITICVGQLFICRHLSFL